MTGEGMLPPQQCSFCCHYQCTVLPLELEPNISSFLFNVWACVVFDGIQLHYRTWSESSSSSSATSHENLSFPVKCWVFSFYCCWCGTWLWRCLFLCTEWCSWSCGRRLVTFTFTQCDCSHVGLLSSGFDDVDGLVAKYWAISDSGDCFQASEKW